MTECDGLSMLRPKIKGKHVCPYFEGRGKNCQPCIEAIEDVKDSLDIFKWHYRMKFCRFDYESCSPCNEFEIKYDSMDRVC